MEASSGGFVLGEPFGIRDGGYAGYTGSLHAARRSACVSSGTEVVDRASLQ